MAFALRSAAASLAAQQHSTAPLRCIRCAAARSGFFGVSPVQAARLPKLGGRPGWCLTVALCIFYSLKPLLLHAATKDPTYTCACPVQREDSWYCHSEPLWRRNRHKGQHL